MTKRKVPVSTGVTMGAISVVALVILFANVGLVRGAANTISGSGVIVSTGGDILPTAHVVNDCAQISVRNSSGVSTSALLVVRDEPNDLAVIRSKTTYSSVAAFREGPSVRAGDAVVTLGYPLSGLLS